MPNLNTTSGYPWPQVTATYSSSGALTGLSSQDVSYRTTTTTRTSAKTANYWQILRTRPSYMLPMNGFNYAREDIRKSMIEGKLVQTNTDGSKVVWTGRNSAVELQNGGVGSSLLAPSAAEESAFANIAITKLRNKVKDQKVNLVQAYAERAQTANLIAVTAARIAASVTSLRHGDFRRAADALGIKAPKRARKRFAKAYAKNQSKAISNGWLELQYGWSPLLGDVYGSCELLAQKITREVANKATAQHSVLMEDVVTSNVINDGRLTTERRCEYTVKYTVYFSSSSDALHTLAQVGITNPALIAWELMPWSFVVDWFTPIGNYLQSLDATLGLKFHKGCRTIFMRQFNYGISRYDKSTKVTRNIEGVAEGTWRKTTCVRQILTDFPVASFPSFKNPLSFTHAANAIALLRLNFKRAIPPTTLRQ